MVREESLTIIVRAPCNLPRLLPSCSRLLHSRPGAACPLSRLASSIIDSHSNTGQLRPWSDQIEAEAIGQTTHQQMGYTFQSEVESYKFLAEVPLLLWVWSSHFSLTSFISNAVDLRDISVKLSLQDCLRLWCPGRDAKRPEPLAIFFLTRATRPHACRYHRLWTTHLTARVSVTRFRRGMTFVHSNVVLSWKRLGL